TANDTICTNGTQATACTNYAPASGSPNYLARNASDTSAASITAGNNLYTFTNNNGTPTTGGVLKLDNSANTGSTFTVTASGNPGAGKAVIFASNTNATPSGNLID